MSEQLLSAQEVAQRPGLRIFDCRHDLADPDKGLRLYAQGHIPGALHVHLDHDLSGVKDGQNGRHPLPEKAAFVRWLGAQGVGADDHVIAYDDAGGPYAARLWWMLRWVGHRSVSLLDGGFPAWQAAGLPVETDAPQFEPTSYVAGEPLEALVDTAAVEANLASPAFTLVDARAAGRYAGEGETIDPVAGHIPGALNRPFAANLDADGRFKSAEALRGEFGAVLAGRRPDEIVHQCGSGVTACHNLFAMELAGLPGARLYPGSWSAWCSDPARPVATGPA